MINGFFLILSLIGLWVGTELIVKAAISLSRKFRLRETFIGLSVLAFGTDLPELAIMVDASIFPSETGGEAGIILGSALGSAISQISFVLGTVSLVGAPYLLRRDLVRHGLILCLSIVALFIFALGGTITRLEGLILITLYIGYYILLIRQKNYRRDYDTTTHVMSMLKSWGMIIVGFMLLLGNAKLAVVTSLAIAAEFDVTSSAVAVVIIGLGSSLPELSLSGLALAKKRVGVSLGNLVGSNILDTLLVPGIGATIHPLVSDKAIIFYDIPVLFVVTLLALYFLFISPKGISKSQALLLMAVYGIYVVVRFGGEIIF